jgi:hypothetical protein
VLQDSQSSEPHWQWGRQCMRTLCISAQCCHCTTDRNAVRTHHRHIRRARQQERGTVPSTLGLPVTQCSLARLPELAPKVSTLCIGNSPRCPPHTSRLCPNDICDTARCARCTGHAGSGYLPQSFATALEPFSACSQSTGYEPGTRCTLGDWIQTDAVPTSEDNSVSLEDPGALLAGVSVKDRL